MTLLNELQARSDAYVAACRAGDAAGCADVFTEDAVLYSTFAPPRKPLPDRPAFGITAAPVPKAPP